MIACDLGSNTLRVVEVDCEGRERVREFERIVKTAEGVERDGQICDAAVSRVVAAVRECRDYFDFSKGYKAVTTAAVRMAGNGREVVERIAQETGIVFEIIDGAREAEFTRLGVENRLDKLGLGTERYILLDLGGGSSEIVVKMGDEVLSRSFAVGIVTMVEKYGLVHLEEGIRTSCKPIAAFARMLKEKPAVFVGSSGTPTTIAAFLQGIDYAHYDYRKINGYRLTLQKMEEALQRLLALDKASRQRWVGVGRDDLIIAGVKILIEIVSVFGYEEIIVIDDGLREGVALSQC
ncbi:MAG: phosphatase [Sulfurospirillum sp.]|nr:MAG: phosphatase [Sulfurospirillum sp.]